LRNQTYFSLAELNEAIRVFRKHLNEDRPIRRLGVTRRQLLEELDRPELKPLPTERYVFAQWHVCRVAPDYHIEVDKHYYSVPYQLARTEVDVRLTARTVEVFFKGKRVAAHLRNSANRKYTTLPEHMASSHRRFANWTVDRIHQAAALIGQNTSTLCELILENKPHPEQGFRACLGIIRLAKSFGDRRLEAAAARALEIGAYTYRSVKSILDNNLDRHPRSESESSEDPIIHSNIRGRRYYN